MTYTPVIIPPFAVAEDGQTTFAFFQNIPPLKRCGNCGKEIIRTLEAPHSQTFHHVGGDWCMAVKE